jgi:Na+-driven multidrug efflux pump
VVFVLDGVLIGAGDGGYLARGGLVTLVVYAPVVLLVATGSLGLVAVWTCFAGLFMGARFVVLVRRARGEAWLVTGARPARRPERLSPRGWTARARR